MNAVVYSPQAQRQLADIWSWVETRSGFPERAEAFVDSIIEFCDNLADNSQVGIQRDDLRPGLRVVGFRTVSWIIARTSADIEHPLLAARMRNGRLSSSFKSRTVSIVIIAPSWIGVCEGPQRWNLIRKGTGSLEVCALPSESRQLNSR